MLVGDQHAVEPVDVGVEELLAEVRRGVDQDAGAAARAAAARPAARCAAGGSSDCSGRRRPSRAPAAARPSDEPQPRIVKRRLMRRPPPGRGTLLNSRKKFSVVCAGDLVRRDAAGLGQHLGGLDHVGRLAALAAEFAGREIGRVGLDQDAVGRQVRGDGAQLVGFLEGQDAGERHVEAELDAGEGQVAAAGEAMQHGREGALPRFLAQDFRHVVVGLAGMDHQRQAGLAGGRDMGAEALLLRVARASCRSDSRAPPRRSPRPWDGACARPVRRRRCRVPRGRGADGCRPSRTRRESARRWRADRPAAAPGSRS